MVPPRRRSSGGKEEQEALQLRTSAQDYQGVIPLASAEMLEKVAKTFEIEPSVLLTMQRKSAITRKYGPEYLATMNITPELYEMDSLMKGLLPEQRQMIMIQIKALVEGNIASGKMTAPVRRKSHGNTKIRHKA